MLDGHRFADQKYLDQFERLFDGVVVLRHPGANLAPWNLERHALSSARGTLWVDETAPLIFFHFHGMRSVGSRIYVAEHHRYGAPFNGLIRRAIYRPYIEFLERIKAELASRAPLPSTLLTRNASKHARFSRRLIARMRQPAKNVLALLRGHAVVVVKGRAI